MVGFLERMGPIGFTLWFGPTFIGLLALTWSGRVDRVGPVAAATGFVGLWPLYRWLATGDVRTARAFFVIAGITGVLALIMLFMEFVNRRGWLVTSPLRRRVLFALVIANAAMTVSHWPTGRPRTMLEVVWFIAMICLLFVPSRRRVANL
jgi:hypothetical protein